MRIGESVKRFDHTKQGEKAIGALAWQTLGDRVFFISRQESMKKSVAWSCEYLEGDLPRFESRLLEGLVKMPISGTMVTIERLNDSYRQLSPKRLESELGSKFRDLLKSGTKITIVDVLGPKNSQQSTVRPEEYAGELIVNETLQTTYGPIMVEFYVNPNRKSSIRLKHGIQTLLEDIADKIDYLQGHTVKGRTAWRKGRCIP